MTKLFCRFFDILGLAKTYYEEAELTSLQEATGDVSSKIVFLDAAVRERVENATAEFNLLDPTEQEKRRERLAELKKKADLDVNLMAQFVEGFGEK